MQKYQNHLIENNEKILLPEDKMQNDTFKGVVLCLTGGLFILSFFILLSLSGCSTPIFSTDNKFLLRLPGAERKSDEIPGVLRPWERIKLIQEKGKKGKHAPKEEKEILVYQLIQEYERSTDPNVRRASIDALEKITSGFKNEAVEKTYIKAFRDPILMVRLSAADAMGSYCMELKSSEEKAEARDLAAKTLAGLYRDLPFSIAAGAKKENDERKDLRLAIIRNLAKFKDSDSAEIVQVLGEALQNEKLDDGALQMAAMRSLEITTHKKYGYDAERWVQYIDYTKNKRENPPEELSLSERFPKPDLPMFK
ncbi:MAG: HEAT repeat domain-containing protein [Planctomycetia bacterium]|nr:HEAT repeat domain-containing protein [Planctomycetia bacterium]